MVVEERGSTAQDVVEDQETCFGDYRVVRLLGVGGMGRVFEAFSERQQRRAAIKVMNPDLVRYPGMLERFLSEARAANAISDPGIITMLEIDQTADGRPYLVMEFIEGETLSQRIVRGPVPVPVVLRLGWQMAHSLSVAHQRGVIHRDLKPDNIMVVSDPTVIGGERTKILDFGIAKLVSTKLTQTGARMGTPRYMAPEQMEDTSQVDGRADVYGLGLILHEMLLGRFVAVREPLPPPVPAELSALILRMQALDLQLRPSMADVASTLARIGAAAGTSRSSRRLALGAALASFVALSAAAYLLRPHPSPVRPPLPPSQPKAAPPRSTPPAGMAGIAGEPALAMDITEVTNRSYADWLTRASDTLSVDNKGRMVRQEGRLLVDLFPQSSGITYGPAGFVVAEGLDVHPVVQVTWEGAQRYCQAQGKRLPTEEEWSRAATGLSPDLGKGSAGCRGAVFGRLPGGPCEDATPGSAEVRHASADRTPEGVHDLGGNVAEWTASRSRGSARAIVRGGDFARPAAALTRARSEVIPESAMPNVGFRCAKSL